MWGPAIALSVTHASLAKAERIATLAEKIYIHRDVANLDFAFKLAENFINYKDKYIESARNK